SGLWATGSRRFGALVIASRDRRTRDRESTLPFADAIDRLTPRRHRLHVDLDGRGGGVNRQRLDGLSSEHPGHARSTGTGYRRHDRSTGTPRRFADRSECGAAGSGTRRLAAATWYRLLRTG